MKAVILAGGFGTRLSEETDMRPKPMVEIGGRPILWHIMKIYGAAGVREFVICAGYKASVIKRYFFEYFLENSDIEVDTATGEIKYLSSVAEPWTVKVIDTGLETMTGGRLKRVKDHLGAAPFCMTYGDGVADIDIGKLTAFHTQQKRLATVTAVRAPGRFGILSMGNTDHVQRFHEKPDDEIGWINGGFFVLDPKVIDYIDGDSTIWERTPLERLAADGQLAAMRHTGFWKPMDTLRDKRELEGLWDSGKAPWKR
jgi:glucose-1-phosphate cytidylyltransferase